MPNNELGKFLRIRRGKKSLREFSKELGISHTHLDSIEKGYDPRTNKPVNIGTETINKLSEKLGVNSVTILNMINGLNFQDSLSMDYAENSLNEKIKMSPNMSEEEKDDYFIQKMNEYDSSRPLNNHDLLGQYQALFDKDDRLTEEQKKFFMDFLTEKHKEFDEKMNK